VDYLIAALANCLELSWVGGLLQGGAEHRLRAALGARQDAGRLSGRPGLQLVEWRTLTRTACVVECLAQSRHELMHARVCLNAAGWLCNSPGGSPTCRHTYRIAHLLYSGGRYVAQPGGRALWRRLQRPLQGGLLLPLRCGAAWRGRRAVGGARRQGGGVCSTHGVCPAARQGFEYLSRPCICAEDIL
jgi:hypothetical protein